MIVTIILAIILILSIIGVVIDYHLPDTNLPDTVAIICLILSLAIGVFMLPVSVIEIKNAAKADYLYRQDMIEYTALQTLVDTDNSQIISFAEKIINFNQKVEKYQTYHDDPWVNWFFYKGCENVPYVTIKEDENNSNE